MPMRMEANIIRESATDVRDTFYLAVAEEN
jgi:hypothetical protein